MPETDGPTAEDYRRDSLTRIRVLIVGGGATGQVYGYHLAQAGVEVVYYLKPRHAAEAEQGFTLHRFGLVGHRGYKIFEGYDVYTTPEEVERDRFDQIWLCISSPALRSGVVDDLDEVQPEALWVMLQPGLDDREYMLERLPEERLVSGMIGLVAYQAPLPDEDLWPEGVAYWFPPTSPSLFSGPRGELVANYLQKGGMPAGVRPDVASIANYGSAVLIPFVVALEVHEWSMSWLRKTGETLDHLCAAIGEIFTAVKKQTGASPPSGLPLLTKSWVWKMGLFAAPVLSPFPIEPYLEYHFSKVREQSEQLIDDFVALCEEHGVAATRLRALRDLWYEQREERERPREATTAVRLDPADRPPPEPAPREAKPTVPDLPSAKEVRAARESQQTVPDLPSVRGVDVPDSQMKSTLPEVPVTESTETIRPALGEEPTESPDDVEEPASAPEPPGGEQVKFKEELPADERDKLGREDFIQTELAEDAETWTPGGVSNTMQSFGGSESPASPALQNGSKDDN